MKKLAVGLVVLLVLAGIGAGGYAFAVKKDPAEEVSKVCADWRQFLVSNSRAIADAGDSGDPDVMARALSTYKGDLARFAREARDAGGEKFMPMVRQLRAASISAGQSATAFTSGDFDDADPDGLFSAVTRAMNEGEDLGAESCAVGL